jgi:hypothetical protein
VVLVEQHEPTDVRSELPDPVSETLKGVEAVGGVAGPGIVPESDDLSSAVRSGALSVAADQAL